MDRSPTPLVMPTRRCAMALAALSLLLTLVACAGMPAAVRELPWRDQQGDRGAGVRERDWAMCSDAIESRRSELAACMARKGWRIEG